MFVSGGYWVKDAAQLLGSPNHLVAPDVAQSIGAPSPPIARIHRNHPLWSPLPGCAHHTCIGLSNLPSTGAGSREISRKSNSLTVSKTERKSILSMSYRKAWHIRKP